MVKDILMYLDRTFVEDQKKLSIWHMGLLLFRETIIFYPEIRGRVRSILIESITHERNGRMIDRDLIKSILQMLVEVGIDSLSVYEEEFEYLFLDSTREYYRQEAQKYLTESSCSDYLKKVEKRLEEELSRCRAYLSASSEPHMKSIIEQEFITNHTQTLVNTGLEPMLMDNKIDDLSRMYALLARVPSNLDSMRDCLGKHVRQKGLEIVMDQEKIKSPKLFVQLTLDMKRKYDIIVRDCFKGEKKADKKLKEAFDEFINKDAKCAQYLALFIDDLMRRVNSAGNVSHDEANSEINDIIVIFRHLQDKDIFEEYYRKYLAKRLLTRKSVSEDIEKAVIIKFKNDCGYQYASKLEGMFHDMKISKETLEEYKASANNQASIDVDVDILTASYWPGQVSSSEVILPEVINSCCTNFTQFYHSKHSGRKLVWQTHLGGATIKASFPACTKHIYLTMSTYQMCILLLFNHAEVIALADIREQCNIPEVELRRHLLSMCTPKMKLLSKESKGKGIADDDTFKVNEGFTSKFLRLKVPLISAKEVVVEETDKVPAAVEEDRRYLVEAACVRIMKARRTLSLNELVAEVSHQLSHRFSPDPQLIKKRIESLIERDFLERDTSDRRIFHYIA
jgi:cullin 3